jgi:hypothetical protein
MLTPALEIKLSRFALAERGAVRVDIGKPMVVILKSPVMSEKMENLGKAQCLQQNTESSR